MLACAVFLLAQSRSPVAGISNDILRWTIVLVVGVIALSLAGFLVYRIVMRALADPEPGPSFDLLELKRLRAEGVLTDEEFEKAKSRVIAELSGGPAAKPGPPADNDPTGADAAGREGAANPPPEDPPAGPRRS